MAHRATGVRPLGECLFRVQKGQEKMGEDGQQGKSQDEHIGAGKEDEELIWFKGRTPYN